MTYCLYGTVYNNVDYVEDSVRSFSSSIYDRIVIVDSFSTDGTYEKLKELERDYNLTILRLKSSRGKGRDYALRQCPEGSFTAYVDLDATYNGNLERVITLETDRTAYDSIGIFQMTFVAKRETILNRGGWRDLMYGEDIEMMARVGIDNGIPVVLGSNAPYHGNRERRYEKNPLDQLVRMTKVLIDKHISSGLRRELNRYFSTYSQFHGFSSAEDGRLDGKLSNPEYVTYLYLRRLTDPQELGFRRGDVFLAFPKHDLEDLREKVNLDYNHVIMDEMPYLKREELAINRNPLVYYHDLNLLNYFKSHVH